MPRTISDDERALLSEEELAGLLDPNFQDDDPSEVSQEATADEPEETSSTEEVSSETTEAALVTEAEIIPPAHSGAQPGTTPTTIDAAPAVENVPTEDAPATAPVFTVPPGAEERIVAINSELEALDAKFDDGEISARELRQASRTLQNEADALKHAMRVAADEQQRALHTWSRQVVPQFLAAHPQYQPGNLRFNALNTEVQRLQMESGDSFDPRHLANAHARIERELGATAPAATSTKPAAQASRPEVPPSLAHVPAAIGTDAGGGNEFAHLDRLLASGQTEEWERATARLTPEQQQRYEAQY